MAPTLAVQPLCCRNLTRQSITPHDKWSTCRKLDEHSVRDSALAAGFLIGFHFSIHSGGRDNGRYCKTSKALGS